jgi:hypothetical protein
MKLHLKNLAYIEDKNLLKIILSSADNFPGLYRFNSKWKDYKSDPDFLRVISFLEASHWSELNHKWSRERWLRAHQKIHNLSFGENGRNKDRQDSHIGEMLRIKAINWLNKATSISLMAIETEVPVVDVNIGTTYYVMGSLLRFEESEVIISYNDFDGTYYKKLRVSFEEVSAYIRDTFSEKTLPLLFFKSEIIGRIKFNSSGEGELYFNKHKQNELLSAFTPNAPIFGSIDYDFVLPIRFAKLVGVSNVCA